MTPNPTATPILFDRSVLRARQRRALIQGPATFLLDRVAEDMEERLAAVKRDFADVADIWTPGDALRKPLGDRFKSLTHVALLDSEVLPLHPEQLDLAIHHTCLKRHINICLANITVPLGDFVLED